MASYQIQECVKCEKVFLYRFLQEKYCSEVHDRMEQLRSFTGNKMQTVLKIEKFEVLLSFRKTGIRKRWSRS